MLTLAEKILFALAVLVSLYFTWRGVQRIVRNIASGRGAPDWKQVRRQAAGALFKFLTFQPVFRFRFWPSLLHGLIGWGFIAFLLINLADLIYGYTGWRLLENTGLFGEVYRLLADVANVAILVGIVGMAVRRFVLRPQNLSTRETTLLHPQARFGILRDSAIVAGFIFLHNSARLLGESFYVALHEPDPWQPFITAVSRLWAGVDPAVLLAGEHVMFWLSLGAVVAFLPYFPYSKHLHLFFAPINFALKPQRKSIGELGYINLDDQSIEQFGAAQNQRPGLRADCGCLCLYHVLPLSGSLPGVSDRQSAQPGGAGNQQALHLQRGRRHGYPAARPDFRRSRSEACTSCGACVDVCPVGNEPMRDILEIRRNLAMMESAFPNNWRRPSAAWSATRTPGTCRNPSA